MIEYEKGMFGLNYVFRLKGSVLPRAGVAAMGAVVFSLIFGLIGFRADGEDNDMEDISTRMYLALNTVLGFLLTFRTSQSYQRFWDGAETLRMATREWHDACSQIIAFTKVSKASEDRILGFHELIVRLFSLMTCAAMQYIAHMGEEDFEILNLEGFDEESLQRLNSQKEPRQRMDTCMNWVMQLCVENHHNGILSVPAPILTRAFQELSNGTLHFEKMKTIADTPFPFPYAQMTSLLLLLHIPLTGFMVSSGGNIEWNWPAWALRAALAFIAVWLLWAMNLVAEQIEHPFGDDPNDLPVRDLQAQNNECLLMLLEKFMQTPPKFDCPTHRNSTAPRISCGAIDAACRSHECKVGPSMEDSQQRARDRGQSKEHVNGGQSTSSSPRNSSPNLKSPRAEETHSVGDKLDSFDTATTLSELQQELGETQVLASTTGYRNGDVRISDAAKSSDCNVVLPPHMGCHSASTCAFDLQVPGEFGGTLPRMNGPSAAAGYLADTAFTASACATSGVQYADIPRLAQPNIRQNQIKLNTAHQSDASSSFAQKRSSVLGTERTRPEPLEPGGYAQSHAPSGEPASRPSRLGREMEDADVHQFQTAQRQDYSGRLNANIIQTDCSGRERGDPGDYDSGRSPESWTVPVSTLGRRLSAATAEREHAHINGRRQAVATAFSGDGQTLPKLGSQAG